MYLKYLASVLPINIGSLPHTKIKNTNTSQNVDKYRNILSGIKNIQSNSTYVKIDVRPLVNWVKFINSLMTNFSFTHLTSIKSNALPVVSWRVRPSKWQYKLRPIRYLQNSQMILYFYSKLIIFSLYIVPLLSTGLLSC